MTEESRPLCTQVFRKAWIWFGSMGKASASKSGEGRSEPPRGSGDDLVDTQKEHTYCPLIPQKAPNMKKMSSRMESKKKF